MKKTVLAVTLGILLIAVNLYAADGDLYVDGKVGIGTESPASKLHVVGDQKVVFDSYYGGTAVLVDASSSLPAAGLRGMDFTLTRSGTGDLWGDTISGKFITQIANVGDVPGAITPLIVRTQFGSTTAGTTTITSPDATGILLHWRALGNSRTYSATSTLSDIKSTGIDAVSGSGSLNVTDFRHILVNSSAAGNINSETGLWVDKQIRATNNYGIVLNGDGAGADIVFGTNHDSKIYSSSGELFAKDAAGNVTQISPHDPETGEWIYYSKNIKTGRTVRVNMEELVSDMEKLTGKKYLIETLVNEK